MIAHVILVVRTGWGMGKRKRTWARRPMADARQTAIRPRADVLEIAGPQEPGTSKQATVLYVERQRTNAAHDEAQDRLRRARRSTQSRLDRLLRLSDDPRADLMQMHERAGGEASVTCQIGVPLSSRLAAHLDRVIARQRMLDEDTGAQLADVRGRGAVADVLAARRRLMQEKPDLAVVVEYCGFGLVSQTALARDLGISQQAVGKRLGKGLDLLDEWTRPADETPADDELPQAA